MLLDILTSNFILRALLVGLLGGVSCSMIGVLVTSLRLSFIGPVISHAAFAGGIVSMFVGIDPLIGAFIQFIIGGINRSIN